jgi:hypothetical protein
MTQVMQLASLQPVLLFVLHLLALLMQQSP